MKERYTCIHCKRTYMGLAFAKKHLQRKHGMYPIGETEILRHLTVTRKW